MYFVANVMDLTMLANVAKETSKHAQFIVVVDSFTSFNKYLTEEKDESDGTYVRSIAAVSRVFTTNGWSIRTTIRLTGKKCSESSKIGQCI